MGEKENLLNKILKAYSGQEGLDDLLALSEHWNGFKRENAVRRLGMLGNPVAIPKLIVRANDWVPQVRLAATESLEKLLKHENARAFVLSLPDLHHLRSCRRDDHDNLISNVTNFLLQPDNVHHVILATKNDDPYIARIAVRLCIENSLINRQKLVSNCLSHGDVVVRNIATDLLREFSGETLEHFLQETIQDPYMPIRREAFQIYLRVSPEKGLEIANRFLFDRHVSIRDIAIKQLLNKEVDVEKILMNVLSSNVHSALKIRCAILGLADIGSMQSVSVVKKLSGNSLPSIRKASLQALVKLTGEDAKSFLLYGLKDRSPNVAKESSRLLNKLKIKLSTNELLGIVEKADYRHTLKVCLYCARKINKWERLIFLLGLFRLLMPKDSTNLELLDKELVNWDVDFNLSSSQPSGTQTGLITVEYSKNRHLLNEKRRKSLEFTIKCFGIDAE